MLHCNRRALFLTGLLPAFAGCGGLAGSPSAQPNIVVPPPEAAGGAPLAREQRGVATGQASPRPYLFLGANASIYIDSLPDATPVGSITQGVNEPVGFTMDGNNDLFVDNSDRTITEYKPPYTAPPAATMTFPGSQAPLAFVSDPQGDLAAAITVGPQFEIYEPPYTAPPLTLSIPYGQMQTLTVDANRNVLVLALQEGKAGGNVFEYAAPYTSAPTVPIANLPNGSAMANDPEGNLWVAGVHFLYEYAPPYTGAPLVTYTDSSSGTYLQDPAGITFVGKRDNVAVENALFGLREYVWPPPYTTPAGINRFASVAGNVVGTKTDELWAPVQLHDNTFALGRWTGNFHARPAIFDPGQFGPQGGGPIIISGPVTL